jgi:hypothetical protein
VLAAGLWTLLANDPFGGEPIAIVATHPVSPATTKDENVATATQRGDRPSSYNGPGAATIAIANLGDPAAITPPPGSKTVTIIDGSSGKKQDIVIPGKSSSLPDAKLQKAAPDQRLLEQSRHGVIPKIGADDARPSAVYARPIKLPADKADAPRIAIVVGGLGISASATAEALEKLSPAVTRAFAPYGADLENLASRAGADDHEVLLQTPMEPFDYPDNDPGPQTLLTSLSGEQNVDRLQWLMSRMQGYVGLVSFMGVRFTRPSRRWRRCCARPPSAD